MNIFTQLIKSLYSPKDIASFQHQGIGKTILYVFMITLISIIPTTFYFTTSILDGIDVTKNTIENEVPNFTIENGELSMDSSTPILIEKDEFTIILDSTGTIDSTDFESNDNAIALLKEEFLFVAGGQTQSYGYEMLTDVTISNEDIINVIDTLDRIKGIFLPIVISVFYLFSSAIKFIEISVLGLFGLFLINLFAKKIPYRNLWRLAAYSITLPTVFFTIMNLLQTQVPNGFLLHWAVAIVVLSLAIKELKNN